MSVDILKIEIKIWLPVIGHADYARLQGWKNCIAHFAL